MLPDDPRHGTPNGYGNLHCRCDACRAAVREYAKARGIGGYARNECACGAIKDARARLCRECDTREREAAHGTESRYKHCGCDECRRAMNAARAARRKRPNVAVHGTHSGYSNGCRCDSCRAANTAYARARKQLKRAAA